ncbi:hypothetical protein [Methanolapillus millepedarum]|uniref:Uncharacterized protein n=1 Tax=Methanolapillus millepedarum TaxID=3028296 RepID=A0AA96ZW43_9EURY|nr:hypothetical protein MsAc7_17240 [Methanosarcinaceae archaeon Ac7]
MMERIENAKIPDFKNLIKIGDLEWFEGPLLSHFMSPDKTDYLFYWADVCETVEFEKWIVIPTNEYLIDSYLEKQISLKEIILKATNGISFSVEVNKYLDYRNVFAFYIDTIDPDYLPDDDCYHDFEVRDYSSITYLSKKNESGVLEIKISGGDIKRAEMKFSNYSDALDRLKTIFNGLTNDFVDYVESMFFSSKLNSFERQLLQQKSSFDIFVEKSGSFKIYLKPQSKQIQLQSGSKEYTDEFANEMLMLMASGLHNNIEVFEHFEKLYNTDILDKYLSLARFIKTNQYDLDFVWYNSNTGYRKIDKILKQDADMIIQNVVSYKTKPPREISKTGRFRMLDVKTGSFAFINSEDENDVVDGRYGGTNKEPLIQIKFDKIYSINLEISFDTNGKEKKYLKSFQEI